VVGGGKLGQSYDGMRSERAVEGRAARVQVAWCWRLALRLGCWGLEPRTRGSWVAGAVLELGAGAEVAGWQAGQVTLGCWAMRERGGASRIELARTRGESEAERIDR
jgi:hypothetical protein